MSEEVRLLNAIKESGIKRIAIVDDAFDFPPMTPADYAPLLRHIEDDAFFGAIQGRNDLIEFHTDAIAAITNSDYDSDELAQFTQRLFDAYVDSPCDEFDPAKHFSRSRGPTLAAIRPIMELLKRAGETVEVTRVGSMKDERFAENIADIDLVFADFYLDPGVAPTGEAAEQALENAKRASVAMVKEIIDARGKPPSVVLMSSRDVAAKATEFRKELTVDHGQVVAARFQFIEKARLSLKDNAVEIAEPASDILLDILQTYRFAEGMSLALRLWKQSAKSAIDATATAISDLQIRDFAYLIRFRLEREGQDLIEYLEWLLGEYLTDQTASIFYKDVQANPEVRALHEMQSTVEGAYDGQSTQVANIYHHVRVEDVRAGRTPNLRTGDLFINTDTKRISALLTQECDLVARKDGPRAKRLTVVNGSIKAFDRKTPSTSEFIIVDDAAKNIAWDKKDIETHDFEWATKPNEHWSKLGTLRPMYAQQLQRAVLHDMGRVGAAPWPALYLETEIELWYTGHNGQRQRIVLPAEIPRNCIVMPRRPGAPEKERHEAIFTRTFIRWVREQLGNLRSNSILESGRVHHDRLKAGEAYDELFSKACRGIGVGDLLPHHILVTNQVQPPDGTWAWILVRIT